MSLLLAAQQGGGDVTGTSVVLLRPHTSNASGSLTFAAVSSASLVRIISASAGTSAFTGVSAAALRPYTSSVSGSLTFTASSSVSLSQLTASSDGAFASTGSISAQLKRITTSGTGSLSFGATGSVSLNHITVSVVAESPVPSTGAAVMQCIESAAFGTMVLTDSFNEQKRLSSSVGLRTKGRVPILHRVKKARRRPGHG